MITIELPPTNDSNKWSIYNYVEDIFDGKPCLRITFGCTAYDICLITKDVIFVYNGRKYSWYYYYEENTDTSTFWFREI